MSQKNVCLNLIIIGISLLSCGRKENHHETTTTAQNVIVTSYIASFEQKAKEYEVPANAAIKVLIDSMGSDVELFRTKDFSRLKTLAEEARQTCIDATMGFRQISITIPEALPDTVRFSMTTVSTLLRDAYKSRTDAMQCAVLLFTDSLQIHLADFSKNLEEATLLSDRAGFGLLSLKNWIDTQP